ncbi:MAG: hypothetical protein ACT4PP_13595 [Sporichthyaceae bacterium]
MKATMDRSARSRLAPRLVLIFAVLACVFGWGQSIAAAASSAEPSAPPALAAPVHASSASDTAVHSSAPVSVATAERAVDQATQGPADAQGHGDAQGHAGHGSSHDHSVSCMASSASAAFGAATASDVAPVAAAVIPLQTPLRELALRAGEQRAPGIATFCVLRT